MKKPIVGVVEWPYLDKDGDIIYETIKQISDKITKHGGIPIGIYPNSVIDYTNLKISEIKELSNNQIVDLNTSLNLCDAIIKPGALRIYDYERYIYSYTVEKGIPYLGICAGMQMMSHYGKEKITGNIKNESEVKHHSRDEYAHLVYIKKQTLLYEILKKEFIEVNSRHNYHISDEGIMKIDALATDGIIEAIENPNQRFHLGVQWHPELLNDDNTDEIFDRFIEEAKTKNLTR